MNTGLMILITALLWPFICLSSCLLGPEIWEGRFITLRDLKEHRWLVIWVLKVGENEKKHEKVRYQKNWFHWYQTVSSDPSLLYWLMDKLWAPCNCNRDSLYVRISFWQSNRITSDHIQYLREDMEVLYKSQACPLEGSLLPCHNDREQHCSSFTFI